MDEASPSAPTTPNIPSLVQRYIDGESVYTLAKDMRVSMQTIYNWMHANLGEEYKAIKRQVFINRIADADYEVMTAPTLLDLARAREMSRSVRWDIERAFPDQFGPKQQVQTDNTIRVIIQRDKPQPVVVQEQRQVGARDNVADAVQVVDKLGSVR
jgi:hypothetical protein